MTHFTLSTRNFIAVGVPADAKAEDYDIDKAIYTSLYNLKHGKGGITLSDKEIDCKILGVISTLTEEDCKGLVTPTYYKDFWGNIDESTKAYPNYESDRIDSRLTSALKSFISKLKLEGILAKCILEEPKQKMGGEHGLSQFNKMKSEYNSLPDDLLIIEIL